jgi:hypothetical protein
LTGHLSSHARCLQAPVKRPDRKGVERQTQTLNGQIESINDDIAKIDKRIEEIKKQIEAANEQRNSGGVSHFTIVDECPHDARIFGHFTLSAIHNLLSDMWCVSVYIVRIKPCCGEQMPILCIAPFGQQS